MRREKPPSAVALRGGSAVQTPDRRYRHRCLSNSCGAVPRARPSNTMAAPRTRTGLLDLRVLFEALQFPCAFPAVPTTSASFYRWSAAAFRRLVLHRSIGIGTGTGAASRSAVRSPSLSPLRRTLSMHGPKGRDWCFDFTRRRLERPVTTAGRSMPPGMCSDPPPRSGTPGRRLGLSAGGTVRLYRSEL